MLYDPKFRPKIRVALKDNEPYKISTFLGEWSTITQILEKWAEVGQWWRNENEKMFWRLQLEGDGIVEIFQDQATKDWWLYKVWD